MSRELTNVEYAQMLVEGGLTCFWHWLPPNADAETFEKHLQDAMWRAVRQALTEHGGMDLPIDRPPDEVRGSE